MSHQPNEASFRQSMADHLADKAAEARARYGPDVGWPELTRLLQDRTIVRYPCEIRFAEEPLHQGEFAYPAPRGDHPRDGFVMYVHPRFAARPDDAVALILYQLVAVNFGEFASDQDAEIFGSGVLGMAQDDYYDLICGLADEVGSPAPQTSCGGSCACSC